MEITRPSLNRRTFLKVAGVGAAGLAGAARASATSRADATTTHALDQVEGDPIAAKAAALDYDWEAIFRFVADEVAYEPYAGVLRGPRRTLSGMAGNAGDKAVLLDALLKASFVESRFASGNLDDGVAADLAATTVDVDALRARTLAGMTGESPAEAAGTVPAPGPSPDRLALMGRDDEIDASVTRWAARSIDSTVRTIVDALATAGVALPSGPRALPATEQARHLWVQASVGSDWVDLDPTMPGTRVGATIATSVGRPFTTIPDDLRYRIDITVLGEHVSGAGLTERILLEHSLFADELPDAPIVLAHVKPQGLQGIGVAIGSMLTGGVRYQPVLQVGSTAVIATDGLLIGGDPDDPLSGGGPSGRDGEATGEWLETRITAPDGTTSSARRTLLDRVGDASRRTGAFDPATLPPAVLVDLDAEHVNEYLPLTAVRHLSIATGAMPWPMPDPGAGQEIEALGSPSRMYHVTRDVTNATLAADRGVAIHAAGPNVVMHGYELRLEPDGEIGITESLDLLHRSFHGRPVTGSVATAPSGVLAGVTSHVAERLQGGMGLPADLAPAIPPASVGAIFERAEAEGAGLRVLQGTIPSDLAYPPAAAARLAIALSEGWVAIAPERPIDTGSGARLGWWLVDPTTGTTVDMLDDGGGSVMAEVALGLLVGIVGTSALLALGACLAGLTPPIGVALRIGETTRKTWVCPGGR